MFKVSLYINGVFKSSVDSATHTIQATLFRSTALPDAQTAGSNTPISTHRVMDFQFTCANEDADQWKAVIGKNSKEVEFTF